VTQVAPSSPPAIPAAPAIQEHGRPLEERLASEAKSRPPKAIRMEDLLAALKDRGVGVARTRQVLGGTWGARYCAIAQTEKGLGLATCEFDSAEAARAAVAASKARFDKLMPGRETFLNGQSLLTIAPRDPDLDDESRTVAAVFAALGTR
jgi:hypothetical protein